ncbi:hypothetical protein [Paucilactobacillus wasatchensis]|uniref:Uncharacterized protein n=1 Tax=Paucilactobacillus wasatchensis TaxID=1335616 RepID=A0A0D1A9S6_9LACO|nr:hypothetical protein [Paucilactobacillus wasatchensis]KIS03501.1 hypothetical protein WDC_0873 [Paucilactobacillus wasatchensis]
MKKIIRLSTLLVLSLSLAGCASVNTKATDNSSSSQVTSSKAATKATKPSTATTSVL